MDRRQSNTNKNYYITLKNDELDGNTTGAVTKYEQTNCAKPLEEFGNSSYQTTVPIFTTSKWESSNDYFGIRRSSKVNSNTSST